MKIIKFEILFEASIIPIYNIIYIHYIVYCVSSLPPPPFFCNDIKRVGTYNANPKAIAN